jgi:hypothetical protein
MKNKFSEIVKINFRKDRSNYSLAEEEDFINAADYIENTFIHADISQWNGEEFVKLIKETAKLSTLTILKNFPNATAGAYRPPEWDSYTMRTHYEEILKPYLNGPNLPILFVSLKKFGYENKDLKNFLIGYYKLIWMPERLQEEITLKRFIIEFASSHEIKIIESDFQSKTLSLLEEEALSFVYKLFLRGAEIDTELLSLCNQTLAELQSKDDILRTCIAFLMDFIEIHPFYDGNGRIARLIFNAILYKFENMVVDLTEEKTRKTYTYVLEDPVLEKVYNHLKSIIEVNKPSPMVQKTQFFLTLISISTENADINVLMKKINEVFLESAPSTIKAYQPFFKKMNNSEYAHALRMLATRKEPEAFEVAQIMLQGKKILDLNIDARPDENKYAAIHQAAIHDNQKIFDLLVEHKADKNLPLPQAMMDKLPQEYFPKEPAVSVYNPLLEPKF